MNKILFYSAQKYEIKYFNKINKKFNFYIKYTKKKLNEKTVKLSKGYNFICIFVNDDVNKKSIINKLKKYNIKVIALRCTGYNNVDIKLTNKNKIKVINVKSYSPRSIAEYTLSLILNLNRKIHIAYINSKNKNFDLNNLIGFNMYKKTIGIIGTGKIGQELIKILKGFKMKILAFDIIKYNEIKKYGAKYTSLNKIYKYSDIITLHCPYTKNNHHMINYNNIKKMKRNVLIINTSRGELINSKDIIKAIKNKKIKGIAMDVYENEKNIFFKNNINKNIKDNIFNSLISFNNVLITGHQAFLTKESLINISKITLNNIKKISLNQFCKDLIKN